MAGRCSRQFAALCLVLSAAALYHGASALGGAPVGDAGCNPIDSVYDTIASGAAALPPQAFQPGCNILANDHVCQPLTRSAVLSGAEDGSSVWNTNFALYKFSVERGVTLTLRDVTLVRALVFTYGNSGFVNLQPAIFHMREGSRLLLQDVVLQTLCSTVTYYSQQDFSGSVQVLSSQEILFVEASAGSIELQNVTLTCEEGVVLPSVVDLSVHTASMLTAFTGAASSLSLASTITLRENITLPDLEAFRSQSRPGSDSDADAVRPDAARIITSDVTLLPDPDSQLTYVDANYTASWLVVQAPARLTLQGLVLTRLLAKVWTPGVMDGVLAGAVPLFMLEPYSPSTPQQTATRFLTDVTLLVQQYEVTQMGYWCTMVGIQAAEMSRFADFLRPLVWQSNCDVLNENRVLLRKVRTTASSYVRVVLTSVPPVGVPYDANMPLPPNADRYDHVTPPLRLVDTAQQFADAIAPVLPQDTWASPPPSVGAGNSSNSSAGGAPSLAVAPDAGTDLPLLILVNGTLALSAATALAPGGGPRVVRRSVAVAAMRSGCVNDGRCPPAVVDLGGVVGGMRVEGPNTTVVFEGVTIRDTTNLMARAFSFGSSASGDQSEQGFFALDRSGPPRLVYESVRVEVPGTVFGTVYRSVMSFSRRSPPSDTEIYFVNASLIQFVSFETAGIRGSWVNVTLLPGQVMVLPSPLLDAEASSPSSAQPRASLSIIVGACVGGSAAVLLMGALAVLLYLRRRNVTSQHDKEAGVVVDAKGRSSVDGGRSPSGDSAGGSATTTEAHSGHLVRAAVAAAGGSPARPASAVGSLRDMQVGMRVMDVNGLSPPISLEEGPTIPYSGIGRRTLSRPAGDPSSRCGGSLQCADSTCSEGGSSTLRATGCAHMMLEGSGSERDRGSSTIQKAEVAGASGKLLDGAALLGVQRAAGVSLGLASGSGERGEDGARLVSGMLDPPHDSSMRRCSGRLGSSGGSGRGSGGGDALVDPPERGSACTASQQLAKVAVQVDRRRLKPGCEGGQVAARPGPGHSRLCPALGSEQRSRALTASGVQVMYPASAAEGEHEADDRADKYHRSSQGLSLPAPYTVPGSLRSRGLARTKSERRELSQLSLPRVAAGSVTERNGVESALGSVHLTATAGTLDGVGYTGEGEGSSPCISLSITRMPEPASEVQRLISELSSRVTDQLTILEPIGQGGYGTVYRGIWRNLDVAVKTVLFQDRSNPTPAPGTHTPTHGTAAATPHGAAAPASLCTIPSNAELPMLTPGLLQDIPTHQLGAGRQGSSGSADAHTPTSNGPLMLLTAGTSQAGSATASGSHMRLQPGADGLGAKAAAMTVAGAAALAVASQQRAVLEAAVSCSVAHPNVVATYHYDITPVRASGVVCSGGLQVSDAQMAVGGISDWKLYLVQEFCDAGSMAGALDRRAFHDPAGMPNLPLLLCVLTDIARGMAHIHSRSIVHGDLNPSNILLRTASPHKQQHTGNRTLSGGPGASGAGGSGGPPLWGPGAGVGVQLGALSGSGSGTPLSAGAGLGGSGSMGTGGLFGSLSAELGVSLCAKVADFGLCGMLAPGKRHISNALRGTPFYTAPETVATGTLTKASDVYSFGVIAWEVYTGRPPFTHDPQLGFVRNEAFPRLPPHTPPTLANVTLACLHHDPEARPTFDQILERFASLQTKLVVQLQQRLSRMVAGKAAAAGPSPSPGPGSGTGITLQVPPPALFTAATPTLHNPHARHSHGHAAATAAAPGSGLGGSSGAGASMVPLANLVHYSPHAAHLVQQQLLQVGPQHRMGPAAVHAAVMASAPVSFGDPAANPASAAALQHAVPVSASAPVAVAATAAAASGELPPAAVAMSAVGSS